MDLWEADAPILRGYLASPRLHVRTHAVALISLLPGWAPVRILLAVDAPSIFATIRDHLRRWLARHRLTIGPPTPFEREVLRACSSRARGLDEPRDFARVFGELPGAP